MDIKYCKLYPRDMDSKKVDQDKPKLVLGCFVSSCLFLELCKFRYSGRISCYLEQIGLSVKFERKLCSPLHSVNRLAYLSSLRENSAPHFIL